MTTRRAKISILTKPFRVLLALLLCIGVIALIIPSISYASSTAYVSLTGIDYYNGLDHTAGMTVNGVQATCLNHEKITPAGLTVTSGGTIDDEAIRKALYYGNGGPCDDGTWDRVQTSIACSMAYSGNGSSHGNDDAEAFYYALDDYETPPDSFVVTLWESADSYQNIATWELLPTGSIALQKTSSNPDLTTDNACYSLEGALYGIYLDSTCSDCLVTMTTDSDGFWCTENNLSVGTYWVKEISAPLGYALDDAVYQVDVTSQNTTLVNTTTVSDTPQNSTLDILISKVDFDTGLSSPQGSATLEGALFAVAYYDGYYDSAEEAALSGEATRTWIFETDDTGVISFDESYLVSGDSLYLNSSGEASIPLGTLIIQEIQAPEGYLLDTTVYLEHITSQGTSESVDAYSAPTQAEQVITGGVTIQKIDSESGLESPLGAASLEETVYEIISINDNSVRVDGVDYDTGEVVATITTQNGWASTTAYALPYGSYQIQEVSTGEGYNINSESVEFSITTNGEIVEISGSDAIANQVKRGDLELYKQDESTQTALAGVVFKITSQTTGESHLVVTDENGFLSTASSYQAHTTNTNANDDAEQGAYDSSAGVWFGLTQDGWTTEANDSLGALPYDTYDIEELPCEANEGLQLITLTDVVISQDTVTIDLGTIDDPTATISTTAYDAADGDKILSIGQTVTLIDYITYDNLITGREYIVYSSLVDKDTGDILCINGEELTACVSFTPNTPSGYLEVSFTFDTSEVEASSLVVFEILTCDGRIIASHEDLDDPNQTVDIEQIPEDPIEDPSSLTPETGDNTVAVAGTFSLLTLAGALCVFSAYKQRKRQLQN